MATANDIYQVKHVAFSGQQYAFIVRHWLVQNVTGTGMTDAALATAFDNLFAPLLKPLITASASYYGTQVQKIWPLPIFIPAGTSANTGIGTAAVNSLPKQTCGLISLRTAIAGRKGRGRLYVPFPSVGDDTAAGAPVAGYVTRLNTLGAQLNVAQTLGVAPNQVTLRSVVYHRALHTTDAIITCISSNLWATQRRRGDYGRVNVAPF